VKIREDEAEQMRQRARGLGGGARQWKWRGVQEPWRWGEAMEAARRTGVVEAGSNCSEAEEETEAHGPTIGD
jgi:hypothetical protein